jgi:uncharacterized protein YdeI (YjbR/CyaY-like superfamily)
MPKKDSRVDAYIAKSADFAKPILQHLRQLMHEACPEVEETIKWGHPTFVRHGLLGGMSAFKHHCSFGFWRHARVEVPPEIGDGKLEKGMGQLGRITSLSDLPSDEVLVPFIKQSIQRHEEGPPPEAKRKVKKKLIIPGEYLSAIGKNKKALAAFQKLSPSHQREYVEWWTEAKREETRANRLKTTIAWLTEGKSRNWKYTNC